MVWSINRILTLTTRGSKLANIAKLIMSDIEPKTVTLSPSYFLSRMDGYVFCMNFANWIKNELDKLVRFEISKSGIWMSANPIVAKCTHFLNSDLNLTWKLSLNDLKCPKSLTIIFVSFGIGHQKENRFRFPWIVFFYLHNLLWLFSKSYRKSSSSSSPQILHWHHATLQKNPMFITQHQLRLCNIIWWQSIVA